MSHSFLLSFHLLQRKHKMIIFLCIISCKINLILFKICVVVIFLLNRSQLRSIPLEMNLIGFYGIFKSKKICLFYFRFQEEFSGNL